MQLQLIDGAAGQALAQQPEPHVACQASVIITR
jgi:hypothetical protein